MTKRILAQIDKYTGETILWRFEEHEIPTQVLTSELTHKTAVKYVTDNCTRDVVGEK